jgi:hypothetical protein
VLDAAALTLEDAHDGRLSFPFAAASFVTYDEKLRGADTELAGASGGIDGARRAQLVQLVRAAQPVLANPCLDATCDWQGQVSALMEAGRALADAIGE